MPDETKKSLNKRMEDAVQGEIPSSPHDPQRPSAFEVEAARLRRLLPAPLVVRIEHFGNTAIPGVASEPIIDILVEVGNLGEAKKRIVPILEAGGYEYFWRTDVDPPCAWFIKRDHFGGRTHHIHMVEAD